MRDTSSDSERPSSDDIARRLAEIEASLMDEVGEDQRFRSGATAPAEDLEFVRIAGLTAPLPRIEEGAAIENARDFEPLPETYAEDFADNDDSHEVNDSDYDILDPARIAEIRFPEESNAVGNLRSIIADLARLVDEEETDDEAVDADPDGERTTERVLNDSGSRDFRGGTQEQGLETSASEPADQAEELYSSNDADNLPEILAEPIPTTSGDDVVPPLAREVRDEAALESLYNATPIPRKSRPDSASERLALAGMLLQDLEAQERKAASTTQAPMGSVVADAFEPVFAEFSNADYPAAILDDAEPEAEEYDASNRLRRRGHGARAGLRGFLLLGLAIAILAGAYFAYRFYEQEMASPVRQFNRAKTLLENDQYVRASDAFREFVRRHPASALTPDAQFMAAYALQASPQSPRNAAYTTSAELFREFIVEHPSHPKRPRAETLLGSVHFKLGEHEEAIRILSRPNRRLEDPDAYLPSLRIVAQANAALGHIDEARSAYLRAASVESNFAPDEDYLALAELYRGLARGEEDAAKRAEHQSLALEQWNRALNTAGLTAARKRGIRALIESEQQVIGTLDQAQTSSPSAQTNPEPLSSVEWQPAPVSDEHAAVPEESAKH